MVASFASRPLRWFTLLSLPFLVISTLIIVRSLVSVVANGDMSIPIAGSGLIFFALAAFLIVGGGIGELIHKTGDFDEAQTPLITFTTDEDIEASTLCAANNQKGRAE